MLPSLSEQRRYCAHCRVYDRTLPIHPASKALCNLIASRAFSLILQWSYELQFFDAKVLDPYRIVSIDMNRTFALPLHELLFRVRSTIEDDILAMHRLNWALIFL